MAISSSSIASSSTLNELRTQFNNLVTDVTAIEGGTISYTTLNTTNTNTTILNVKEDGTIVFEGATDDGFETTLTVVDPTADRTITFPNETGTVHTTGGDTTHTNIIIADGANIGSASDTNAIGISSGGVISVTATTANTSATDGALTVAGGLGVAADVSIGDDLRLISDGAVLNFGADSDVTLTHVADTGILLNGTSVIQFNDASQSIGAPSNAILDINATDEIELNATLLDVNANINASGTYTGAGLMTTGGNIVIPDAGTIGSASDTNAIAIGADGDITLTQDLELQHDGAILSFGADDDTTLTHTDGSGLTLNSTNKLMFNDASQFIQGASATVLDIAATDEIELTATLIDVVGNAAVSGTLDVTGVTTSNAGVVVDNITIDGTEIDLSSGDLTIDVAGDIILDTGGQDVILKRDNVAVGGFTSLASSDLVMTTAVSDKDIIFKGIDDSSAITALTLDMSAAGAAIFNNNVTVGDDLKLITDASVLSFGVNSEIALTHVHNTGLLLTDSGGSPTLQLHDAGESLSSDGSKLILTSNSVAFNFPNADGTDGQVLKTDGSGTLSFITASANTPSSADGQALGSASLEWSDLFLADAGTIQFGNDQDVTLTHVADTGLLLNTASVIQFRDSAINIGSPADGDLDINADDEIELNSTLIDINGNVEISGTTAQVGVATFTARDIHSAGITVADAGNIGSASDLDAIAIGADGDVTLTQDLELQHDGAILSFGANDEIALTHVHDTGLLLTDSGGTPTLQLHDSNESIASDGSKVIITSGGTAFSLPTSDGSNGQVLGTNGSGVLSFADTASSAADDISAGDAAVNITTSSGNITIDAAANDSDIIFKGTDATADITMLTLDGSDAGKMLPNNGMDLNGKELILDADADTSITADTDDKIDYRIGGADVMQMNATAFSGGAIYENADDIAANYSITAGKNAFSVGPITIASGVTVTVPSGQRWFIL